MDNDKTRRRLASKRWRKKYPERQRAATKRWKDAHPDYFREKGREYAILKLANNPNFYKERYARNREVALARTKAAAKKLKDEIFNAYGGYRCVCCGETEPTFLSIDHKDNDGYEQRKAGLKGATLHRWLRKNNYPSNFQILCMNCQFGRKHNGGICPHVNEPWMKLCA